jgi:hypothetical protein
MGPTVPAPDINGDDDDDDDDDDDTGRAGSGMRICRELCLSATSFTIKFHMS